jgi:hypothetical protein
MQRLEVQVETNVKHPATYASNDITDPTVSAHTIITAMTAKGQGY